MEFSLNYVSDFAKRWEAQPIKKKYPRYDYGDLIFIKTDIDADAQSLSSVVIDEHGETKWDSGGIGDSTPLVDTSARDINILMHRGLSGYAIKDTILAAHRNAARQGIKMPNPVEAGVNAVTNAFHSRMQKMVTIGDDTLGVKGLFNNPNIGMETAEKTLLALSQEDDGVYKVYNWLAKARKMVLKRSKTLRDANQLIVSLDMGIFLDNLIFPTGDHMSVLAALRKTQGVVYGRDAVGLDVRAQLDMPDSELMFQDRSPEVARIIRPHGVRFKTPRPVSNGFIRDAYFSVSSVQVLDLLGLYKYDGV